MITTPRTAPLVVTTHGPDRAAALAVAEQQADITYGPDVAVEVVSVSMRRNGYGLDGLPNYIFTIHLVPTAA